MIKEKNVPRNFEFGSMEENLQTYLAQLHLVDNYFDNFPFKASDRDDPIRMLIIKLVTKSEKFKEEKAPLRRNFWKDRLISLASNKPEFFPVQRVQEMFRATEGIGLTEGDLLPLHPNRTQCYSNKRGSEISSEIEEYAIHDLSVSQLKKYITYIQEAILGLEEIEKLFFN